MQLEAENASTTRYKFECLTLSSIVFHAYNMDLPIASPPYYKNPKKTSHVSATDTATNSES